MKTQRSTAYLKCCELKWDPRCKHEMRSENKNRKLQNGAPQNESFFNILTACRGGPCVSGLHNTTSAFAQPHKQTTDCVRRSGMLQLCYSQAWVVITVDVTNAFVTVSKAKGPCVITANRQWFVCLSTDLAPDTAGFHKQLSKNRKLWYIVHSTQGHSREN